MSKNLIKNLKNGNICVLLTDTIYGICCNALNIKSVEKLYKIRKRDPKKAVIILISSLEELNDFDIKLDDSEIKILENLTPAKLTFLLKPNSDKFKYIQGSSKYLSFRIPDNDKLRELLKNCGPIIAPSANTQGNKPASNIDEAKEYFRDFVDYYEDSGVCENSKPSTVAIFENNLFEIIRQGAYIFDSDLIK